MSILVLGTVALDTLKTPFGVRKRILGGSAVHFSMIARIFTDVHLVANVGVDFPAQHISFLKKKKIVLDSLRRDEGKTFHWQGEYKGDLNTAITLKTELGVLASFKPLVAGPQLGIKNIFLANVDPEIQMSLLRAMHPSRLLGLDSMNYWIDTKRNALKKVLKKVDVYVANDQEARSLTQEASLIRAAHCLASFGPKIVLIKKGEHGSLIWYKGEVCAFPAYPVERVIDPTGAGDSFAGGFMGYLSGANKINDVVLRKAVAYGTIAASFNVQGFGVECTSALTLPMVEKRLQRFREGSYF